eukprot:CAMPEP_0172469740 /NCGR_PEP_ID=MMETSP1065-20121228/64534_1 /TAXON_ID=265537 /ORGANISM="Amphiprora paludosa, Strain CCMP125" /LENGTH=42 /DNA_ID= /DNA_START= /DNA_END= /DNA_ORIENTATION=
MTKESKKVVVLAGEHIMRLYVDGGSAIMTGSSSGSSCSSCCS